MTFFHNQNEFKEEYPLPFLDLVGLGLPFIHPYPNPNYKSDLVPRLGVNLDVNSTEIYEILSNISLKYIRQTLLEED